MDNDVLLVELLCQSGALPLQDSWKGIPGTVVLKPVGLFRIVGKEDQVKTNTSIGRVQLRPTWLAIVSASGVLAYFIFSLVLQSSLPLERSPQQGSSLSTNYNLLAVLPDFVSVVFCLFPSILLRLRPLFGKRVASESVPRVAPGEACRTEVAASRSHR